MNNLKHPVKTGLVLSGGGAKGAYQVGVVKALAELEIPIEVVAGASIGALNGSIVSSSRDLNVAAQKLERLWVELGKSSPLKVNVVYLDYFLLLGKWAALLGARANLPGQVILAAGKMLSSKERTENGIFSSDPIRNILIENLTADSLNQGLDFYVSVFEALNKPEKLSEFAEKFFGIPSELTKDTAQTVSWIADMGEWLLSAFGVRENRDSEFIRVQDLPAEQQNNVILASAAHPLMLQAQKISDQRYRDGGMGGNMRSQGNTPADPLVNAGCTHLIVTHLADGSLWSRSNFPDTTIIEIRPQKSMSYSPLPGKDLLSFDPAIIESRMEQGYLDTMACIRPIQEILKLRSLRKETGLQSQQVVEKAAAAVKSLDDDEFSRHFSN